MIQQPEILRGTMPTVVSSEWLYNELDKIRRETERRIRRRRFIRITITAILSLTLWAAIWCVGSIWSQL